MFFVFIHTVHCENIFHCVVRGLWVTCAHKDFSAHLTIYCLFCTALCEFSASAVL